MQALGEHCGNLRRICVSGCLHLTDASLVSIGQGCPYLSTLEVADCKQFTDAGFQALARVSFVFLEVMKSQSPVLICTISTELSLVGELGSGRLQPDHRCHSASFGPWLSQTGETQSVPLSQDHG